MFWIYQYYFQNRRIHSYRFHVDIEGRERRVVAVVETSDVNSTEGGGALLHLASPVGYTGLSY